MLQDSVASENGAGEQEKDLTDADNPDAIVDSLENNNISSISHSNSKTDSTDQSDISVCLECGSVDPSDSNDYKSKDQSETGEPGATPEVSAHSSTCDKSPRAVDGSGRRSHSRSPSGREKRVTHKRRKHIEGPGGLQFPYSVLPCKF